MVQAQKILIFGGPGQKILIFGGPGTENIECWWSGHRKYLFFVVALVGVTLMDITIYSRASRSYINGHKGKINMPIDFFS